MHVAWNILEEIYSMVFSIQSKYKLDSCYIFKKALSSNRAKIRNALICTSKLMRVSSIKIFFSLTPNDMSKIITSY